MHMDILYCTCNINRLYCPSIINPSRTKFSSENINLCFHFVSSPKTEIALMIAVSPCGRQGPVNSSMSISWFLIPGDASGQCIGSHAIGIVILIYSSLGTTKLRGVGKHWLEYWLVILSTPNYFPNPCRFVENEAHGIRFIQIVLIMKYFL